MKPKPTVERLLELFDYDPINGHLIRRVTVVNRLKGSVAGSINQRGHVNVAVDKLMMAAHQIVFMMHRGYCPDEIDHRNQIKTDNRIENLRECTSSQNKGNIGLLKSNSSGFRGVSFNTRRQKWHAQIKIQGKQTYLGSFDLPEQAARAYDHAAMLYFGKFAHLNYAHP